MKKTLWVLMDDRMGSVGQARGVLQALGDMVQVVEKKIIYNRWAKLPNTLKGVSLVGLNKKDSDNLQIPFPDLVLSISRRTAPIARWIKKQSNSQTKIIQLIHPGSVGIEDFDLVLVSEHDRHKKSTPNMVYITGCPHRITEKSMQEAHEKWQPIFSQLPQPLTTVIVGGAIKNKAFTAENAQQFGQEIREIHQKTGGSILITSSRRTGAEAEKIIMEELRDIPAYTYLWGEKKDNPFMGFLACGEKIIITGDSVSMCSEACGSGNPVLIFEGENWLTKKHQRFIKSLYDGSYAIAAEDPQALAFKPRQRLDTSAIIGTKIAELI